MLKRISPLMLGRAVETIIVLNARNMSVVETKISGAPGNGVAEKRKLESPVMNEAKRVKRRKYALLISYSGVGYYGLQRNPGTKTIEDDLLAAFHKVGLISDEGLSQPQSFQFQRAARTDKGVSAVRQVLSARLPEDLCDLHEINDLLPEQIRLMAIKRATKGFNCKMNCDARTYSYTMPSFALARQEDLPKGPAQEVSSDQPPSQQDFSHLHSFRISSQIIQKTNSILRNFLGTHNYHNFTSRRKPLDPSCQRYIISFNCSNPIQSDNMEFVTLKVKGQSFMLHQIRKMVGLAIAIVRGLADVETIAKAWQKNRVDIPIAPGLGLVLEEVHYDRYNKRYGHDGLHEPVEWSSLKETLEQFKTKYILSTIFRTEKEEHSMALWLENLPNHTFDVRESGPPDKKEEEIDNDYDSS